MPAENKIVKRFIKGDQCAFEQIYYTYSKKLYHFCLGLIKDPNEAMEVVQDVFVTLWEKREQISIEQSLSSYLFQSVYHESLDHLKSFSHRQKPTEYQYLEENSTPDSDCAER